MTWRCRIFGHRFIKHVDRYGNETDSKVCGRIGCGQGWPK